jgi:hypothetical protein
MFPGNNGRMRGVQYTVKFSLMLIGLAALLAAQTPDVSLQLATADGKTSFRLGEAITLELSFTSTVPGKYSISGGNSDRSGMENYREEFRVSPSAGTSDPLADSFRGGVAGNGLGWFQELSAKPVVVNKDLNQWLHFDRPGRYQVRAISHRVTTQQKPVQLESNEIEIELVDDPAWRMAQSAEAAHTLRTVPKSGQSEVFQQRMAAARQLWYLDTPESIRESARLLDGSDVQVDYILEMGLMASSRRPLAIATMDQLLADPAQAVTPSFLETLARLKAWTEVPVAGSYPADAAAQPAWRDAIERQNQRQTAIAKELQSRLTAVLERKQGSAKALSLRTELFAAWPDSITATQRAEMAELFFELPTGLQSELLGYQWNRIFGPAMIPVLRKIYDALPENYQGQGLGGPVLERLYELDPAQGRSLILAEIARPVPRFPYSTLSILPDATLPDLEEKLLANLDLGSGLAVPLEPAELIARYATDRVLDRVKSYYARIDAHMRARPGVVESPPRRLAAPPCAPPLYAYFLRTDPAYGEKLLRDVMAERSFELGHCWMKAIGETARYFVNSRWESVALDALNDSTVLVKIDAVKALGEYGSPAAVPRLWESFRYWHDWWKNRPAEINEENRQLEQAYLRTFSQAANWISTADDLARATDLCITDSCRGQMEQARRSWSQPLTVSVSQSGDGSFFVSLLQYPIRSLEEARRRLLQLPKGTELEWKQTTWENRPVPALDSWVGQIEIELSERGITVAR